jgi:hypothetical protein
VAPPAVPFCFVLPLLSLSEYLRHAIWVMVHGACANSGKQRVVCGFSWLLRVADHESVLMDPNLFSSWVHRSVVLLKRGSRSRRQTSSRWRFSRKNDWIVQVIPQHAIKSIRAFSGSL